MSPSHLLAIAFAALLGACAAAQTPPAVVVRVDASVAPPDRGDARAHLPPERLVVGKLAFVRKVAGRRVLVLATEVPDEWARGEPELISSPADSLHVARTEIQLARLPATHDIRSLAVHLYDGPVVVGEVMPTAHWIASQSYGITLEPGSSGDPKAVATEAWTSGVRWLVAELPSDAPDADWARLAALDPPAMPPVTVPDAGTIAEIEAELRARSEWTEAGDAYERYWASQSLPKPHADWAGGASFDYRSFLWRGEPFVLARVSAGEVCEFNAVIGGVYGRRGPSLARITAFADAWPELKWLIDIDDDGELEAVVTTPDGTRLVRFMTGEPLLDDKGPPAGCSC